FNARLLLFFALAVHVVWFAPFSGWLLLFSAWATRLPVLWAVLPPVALSVVERMAFNTTHVGALMKYRVMGAMTEAFSIQPKEHAGVIDRLAQLEPVIFLSAPGRLVGSL